jgi:hypothetical protein
MSNIPGSPDLSQPFPKFARDQQPYKQDNHVTVLMHELSAGMAKLRLGHKQVELRTMGDQRQEVLQAHAPCKKNGVEHEAELRVLHVTVFALKRS